MEVELSGGVAVFVSGAAVDLGPTKNQAVLAALAVNAGAAIPVSRLVELVWGDDPPRTAEKTLQTYVARLRKSCGTDSIERAGNAYRLNVGSDAVDLGRFERLIDDGDVTAALELWRGPPLAGLDAPGLDPVVTRLTEKFLAATESAIAASLDQGENVDVGHLRELVAAYPLREGLWALLMRALYRGGRQAEALRAYAEARAHLVDELGIEPGPDLRELQQRVLDQDPDLEPDAAPTPPEAASSPTDRVSFLFTDIQDSTGLWERHTEVMRDAVATLDRVTAEAVELHGGTVFKNTGDGSYSVFPTSADATNAAVAIQLRVDALEVGNEPFVVRAAVSTGRAYVRDSDWFGPPLNVAARLLDAAHGGQILIGSNSHDSVGNQTTGGVDTTDLGEFRLRGLSRPERIHQVIHAALPRRFPPLRTAMSDERETHEFPPELSSEGRVRFVGRVDMVDQVIAIWEDVCRDSSPMIVTLGGEPGVGKTRFAGEIARRLHEDDGATVLYGRCPEDHPTPFRPFTEAITAYAATRSDSELRTQMGPRAAYLTPMLPHLPDRFRDITPVADIGEETRLEIFDAATTFLESASTSPLVVVLDDIHWADQASLSLMRHLAQHLSTGRLLILATYRDVEVERAHPLSRVLADLRREDRVVRLRMKGVTVEDSVSMTELMLGHELSEPGRETVAQIADDAGGNPFFLQELLKHLMESGGLIRRDGRWTADADSGLLDVIPEGIREVVGRRLDRVSEPCNALLRTASAIPATLDFDVLMVAGELDEDEALDLFDEALEAELITDTAHGYEFSHALIRQTLYDEISTVRKLRLHRRIAKAIEAGTKRDDASVEAMAFHFLEAATSADPIDVTKWGTEAAKLALDRFAYEEAYSLLRRVQDVVQGAIGDIETYMLEAQMAVTAIRTGNFQDASRSVETCRSLVGRLDAAVAAAAALNVAAVLPGRSTTEGTSALVANLLESVDRSGLEPQLIARVEVELGYLNFGSINVDSLLEMSESGDHAARLRALNGLAVVVMPIEDLVQLSDSVQKVVDTARPGVLLDTARYALGSLEARRGNFAEMYRLFDLVQGSPLADKSRNLAYGIARLTDFPRMVKAGDLDAAQDALTRMQDTFFGEFLQIYTSRVIDFVQDNAPSQAFEHDHPAFEVQAVFAHMHDEPLPDRAIGRLIEHRNEVGTLCAAAEAAWERGGSAHVDQITQRLSPASGQFCLFISGFITSAVDYHLGLLAELRGELDEAIDLHLAGLEGHRDTECVLDQAMSATHLVRLLCRRGSAEDIALATELAAEASALIAGTELERAKRLLSEAVSQLPD